MSEMQLIAVHTIEIKKGGEGTIRPGEAFTPANKEEAARLLEIGAAKEPPAPTEPPPPPGERLAAVVGAIKRLDPKNTDLFSQDGKPKVEALGEVDGARVTAQERDMAWAAFTAAIATNRDGGSDAT